MTDDEHIVGMVNGFHSFVSNRHGKFYAGFVLIRDDDVLGVTIMGPYKTERKADKIADKWTRLNGELLDSGQGLTFVDSKAVPDDVRVYITASVTEAVRRGVPEGGAMFGKALH